MITLHGEEIKVGDKVWLVGVGWKKVEYIDEDSEYSIKVDGSYYSKDGEWRYEYASPYLFWKEQTFDLSKPLPELEIDTKVLVWNYDSLNKQKRHFSHFDKEGKIHTFYGGSTSFSKTVDETTIWDSWELYEEDK